MKTPMNYSIRVLLITIILCAAVAIPLIARAADSPCDQSGLPNPLGNTCTITGLIVNISRALIGLVAVAATFMFIYGGVMMLTSAGNADQVKRAKDVLRWTTVGLVILFFAGAIMRYIYSVLGPGDFEDISASIGLGRGSLSETVARTLNTIIGVLGIIGVTMVIWSGYEWLTAAGNEKRVERAKQILTAAVAGLVIITLSWTIVNFVLLTSTKVTK